MAIPATDPNTAPTHSAPTHSSPDVEASASRVLELRKVSKQYGQVRALDACSFSVAAGRLTGFLGPNGAGKTTAMRAIFGLVSPDSGEIRWRGRPVDAERCGSGSATCPRSAASTRGCGCATSSCSSAGCPDCPSAAAGARGGPVAGQRWGSLTARQPTSTICPTATSSGSSSPPRWCTPGARRARRAVLRARPVRDGLDVGAAARVARSGAAVLFSSHQLDVVEHLCEDVVVIDSGRVVLQGRLDEIRDAAPYRYLDVTTPGDLRPCLACPWRAVVARDDGHVRLRVPRSDGPEPWLQRCR